MEADDHFLKLDEIIEDDSKFIEVTLQDGVIHPIIQKENSIAYDIKRYLKKATGNAFILTRPGKLYVLAKVHKDNTPLRPVVSTVETA